MKTELATFAGGCFWCTEAIFTQLRGVASVRSGFTGGQLADPTYEQVCTGETGHAEAIEITFDPQIMPYEVLVEIFFNTHDPTTLNRQGHDVGAQYRSAIFFHSPQQRAIAEQVKEQLTKEHVFSQPIVTSIEPAQQFYPADMYHQQYYLQHANTPYCQVVISPKLQAFRRQFAQYIDYT